MRLILTEYFDLMLELCARIMSIFSIALGLPESHFDKMIDNPKAILRATNYPLHGKATKPGQFPASPHRDYGTLTVISTNPSTGLQVYNQ